MQQIFIDIDKLKLVFALARHGAGDAETLAVVNDVAGDTLQFLAAIDQAAKKKAAAEQVAAEKATADKVIADEKAAKEAAEAQLKTQPSEPPSAVEEFGIASEQAQAKRDERMAKRLADEAARKAGRASTDN